VNTDWTPAWAREAIWYQIFPERFRNGNPSSNPGKADIQGAWPHDQDAEWEIHPWTSDWYRLEPYEHRNGMGIWWNLVRRRYGGDLAGIREKLAYLQDLGVTALYLNPIFESPSHHKYDGALYHHVDRTLGPDPEGDRRLIAAEDPADPDTWVWTAADRAALALIEDVHARGMRIILDGVFNHTSITSPFFRDVVEKHRGSRFAEWFKIDSWEDPNEGYGFVHRGWEGVPELPEWRQDENGIVDGPRQYIFECTRRWLAPDGNIAAGIDGWRLDVAYCVAHPFWKEWRRFVKSLNPEAYLTAEVIDTIDVLRPYLEGDEFDAVMNYNVGFACSEYFINRRKRISTTEFDALLADLRDAFGPAVAYVQQNLLDSHDTNRVTSHIKNPDGEAYRNGDVYHRNSKARYNPAYDTSRPAEKDYAVQKLMALFQMTYLGAPMIYYGDEVGMWGANDPCCRKPMIWDDLDYEPEAVNPDGSLRPNPDPVAVNHDLLDTYRNLIAMRREHEALRLGDYTTLLADDRRSIYAYRRRTEGDTIIVALNNADLSVTLDLSLLGTDARGGVIDILNGNRRYPAGASVELPARWGSVLVPG